MNRKIIKQGHNTLTITLPSKWARNLNLGAGDDVELIEKENGLFLRTEKGSSKARAEFDLEGMDIPTLWKYFMAAYREGYDEIKVNFPMHETYDSPYKFFSQHSTDKHYSEQGKKSSFDLLNEIVHRFIGLEIIEHRNDFCIVKDMSDVSTKEFDASIRRVFLLIQQMGEELMTAINKNDTEYLRHTHDLDINLDKFHDHCVRVLNKTGFKSPEKTALMISALFFLENLGDEFKHISIHAMDDGDKIKLSNLKELAELVTKHFNGFYDLFYNFSKEKAINLSKGDTEIVYFMPKFYKLNKGKSNLTDMELEIFNHMRRITRYINSLIELRIEMEF